jgi:hypothetical protein
MVASASPCTSVARGEHKIMVDRFTRRAGERAAKRSEGPEPQPEGNERRATAGERSEAAEACANGRVQFNQKSLQNGAIRANTLENV